MALKQLGRLATVQEDVMKTTDSHINQIEKCINDYKTVKERLLTLADEGSYNVMVPFGTLAFMPGKAVHTNEIRVFLGDGWYVDRSAKQAVGIIDRKIQYLRQQLDEFQQEKDLIKPYHDFTKEFLEESKNVIEIQEECTEEEDTAWRAQHHLNMKKYREEQRATKKLSEMTKEEEELYWDMMEESEMRKTKKNLVDEEQNISKAESSQSSTSILRSTDTGCHLMDVKSELVSSNRKIPSTAESSSSSFKKSVKTVRWQDIVEKETEAEKKKEEQDRKDEAGETSSDDSEEYVELCRPSVIHFVHTPAEVVQPMQSSKTGKDGSGQEILSPADIGTFPLALKSILKTHSISEGDKGQHSSNSSQTKSETSQKVQPVSSKASVHVQQRDRVKQSNGTALSSVRSEEASFANHRVMKIVERDANSDLQVTSQVNAVSEQATGSEGNKRVSKFKASRMH